MTAIGTALTLRDAGYGTVAPATRSAPVEAVRAPAKVAARLAESGRNESADVEAPPSARTRLAETVRPAQEPQGASLPRGASTAFLAQQLAQESLPEDIADSPLQQRAGYAAYGFAGGQRVQVLGPAYAGVALAI